MPKLFTLFFVALIGFGLTAQDADARRMGGGGSIGKQRQMSPAPQNPAQAPAAAPAPGAPAPPRHGRVQYAGNTERTMVDMPATGGATAPNAATAPASRSTRPAWFEDEPFVREAQKHFIRLQDANDRGDLNDIREFVTPEMYAEISLQIQERGGKPNKTEVVTLNAEIADVVTDGDLVIASVRFTGMIREVANAPAEAFSEIWHVQKSRSRPNA